MIKVPPTTLRLPSDMPAHDYSREELQRFWNQYTEHDMPHPLIVGDSVTEMQGLVMVAVYLGIPEILCREYYYDSADNPQVPRVG